MSDPATPIPVTSGWIDKGQGPPVVFLHGYPLTHEIFLPALEHISRTHHVYLLDLPGYGLSRGQEVPQTLGGFAEAVHEFLTARFRAPVAVLGHSFGGYVLLELLRTHPRDVGSIILADTRSQPDSPEARDKRLETARQLEAAEKRLDPAEVSRALFAPATLTRAPSLVRQVQDVVAGVPSRTVIWSLRAIAGRTDLTPVLAEVRVPALVLWGEEDHLIPPEQSRSMVPHLRGCQTAVISGAGHLPFLEAPEDFSRAALRFLEGVGPLPSG